MNNSTNNRSSVPEWLSQEENYIPKTDKDTFINKSILSLLKVISRIKAQDTHAPSKFSVNAVLKTVFTLMLIVLLSVSQNFTFVLIINVYLLAVVSALKAADIIKTFKASLLTSLFTVIILLPSALSGNSFGAVMLTLKVFASITAVNVFSRSTKWSQITSALKRFFLPDIFIFVLDITLKYIFLLGNFTLNMLYALKIRSVGRNNGKYKSLSGISGTVFIKSREMAENMYNAMECRGFTGEYAVTEKFRLTAIDMAYIIINAGIIFAFIRY